MLILARIAGAKFRIYSPGISLSLIVRTGQHFLSALQQSAGRLSDITTKDNEIYIASQFQIFITHPLIRSRSRPQRQ